MPTSIPVHALIQPLPVGGAGERGRGATLSNTGKLGGLKESLTGLRKRESPASDLYVEVRRL